MPSAILRGVGLLREHVETGELLRGPAPRSRAIGPSPPLAMMSGIAHEHAYRNVIALPSRAPAPPRPARSNSTAASSGRVSQIVCVRAPTASPAISAPATIKRPDWPIAAGLRAGSDRCRTKAADEARLSGQRHAEPCHVAQRAQRGKPERWRGHDDQRRKRGAAIAFRLFAAPSSVSKLLNSATRGNTDNAPNTAPRATTTVPRTARRRATVSPSAMKTG